MSLQSIYEAFLASPKAETLAQDAVLSYVTTLTSFSNRTAIIKHLESQRRTVRKRKENTLNAIADRHALFLEVETLLEFVNDGGAYLPGLDQNSLVDEVVVLPIQHVVHFDSDGKIRQIRLYWDQGSLLKSVEVIGSRAKSWPIRDGKDHIRLITSSVDAGAVQAASETAAPRRQSSARPTKDPHGTLEPFAANIPEEAEYRSSYDGPVVQPRSSARPVQRGPEDLFVNEHDNHERSVSPSKAEGLAPKSGAGKYYKENRLFGDAKSAADELEDKFKSPHPNKFDHFDFHDGHQEEAPKPSGPKPRTKHQSQWDFSDFTTPIKLPTRKQHQRSLDFEDQTTEASPVKRSQAQHSRKEANTHFEFDDDENTRPQSRGNQGIKDRTLFSNNVISEEGAVDINARGRQNVSTNAKDRQKDFGNHWEMSDNPTHGDQKSDGVGANLRDRHKDFDPHFRMADSQGADGMDQRRQVGPNQNKAIKMMQPSWAPSDSSPERGKGNRLMNIAGNGMGGRKGAGRGWSIGEE